MFVFFLSNEYVNLKWFVTLNANVTEKQLITVTLSVMIIIIDISKNEEIIDAESAYII